MSHFTALVLYAFFASIVFGITQRTAPRNMIRFGALCFGGAWRQQVGIPVACYLMALAHTHHTQRHTPGHKTLRRARNERGRARR